MPGPGAVDPRDPVAPHRQQALVDLAGRIRLLRPRAGTRPVEA